MKQFLIFISLLLAFVFPATLSAETWYVSNDGADNNAGSREYPFKTISKGAEMAEPGDTVFVLAGIYRERVSPPRGGRDGAPIVYCGEPGKRVYIKGSDVYEGEWETVSDSIYIANLDGMQFTDDCYVDDANPFKVRSAAFYNGTCGQVFVKGTMYRQAAGEISVKNMAGSWWYDKATNKVWIHFSPQHSTQNTVEITTRRRIFAPHTQNLGYIHVQGFIMEHCGNQFPAGFWEENSRQNAQAGALGLQCGHHWQVHHNVIRYAANIGIDVGGYRLSNERDIPYGGWGTYGTDNVIAYNYLIDNGSAGIAGQSTQRMVVRGNVVMWNHNQMFSLDLYEQAGIKFHDCQDGLIEGNYVAENYAYGIWLDNQFPRTRVTRNVIVNSRQQSGLFLEMSGYGFGGVLVDHNLIMGNKTPQVYMHDASGALFVNNLIAGAPDSNGGQGVYIHQVTDRGGTRSDNNAFYNNIICQNSTYTYNIAYPARRGGEQRFLGNLYDGLSARPMLVNRECDVPNPFTDDSLRINVAADLGITVAELQASGAGTYSPLRLTVEEWKTLWGKHTATGHNDSDAEVRAGITASFNPETQAVELNIPADAALQQRDNTRWSADYVGLFPEWAAANSSFPGPFADLQTGVRSYKLYEDGLPILERGKLPGPEEPEEPDRPYADYASVLHSVRINNRPVQIGEADTLVSHTALCGENEITVTATVSKYCTYAILADGRQTEMPVALQPGMNRFIIRVTTIENTFRDYTLEIIRPLDIIRPYYGNVLAVNLNPETNGGYAFSAFQWKKNGDDIPGENGAYLYLSSPALPEDEYNVSLKTADGREFAGCAVQGALLQPRSSESVLKAYPNLARTEVTVEDEDWKQSTGIDLYDGNGTKLRTYPANGFQTIVNISDCPAGIYILRSGKSSKIIIKL